MEAPAPVSGKTGGMNARFSPMEPVSWPAPFNDPGFVHQLKWDGIRIIAEVRRDGARLRTRRGGVRTETYPELHVLTKILQGESAFLDGEAVVLDQEGRPSFGRILRRDRTRKVSAALRRELPVHYVVFDLLSVNGEWLLDRPLARRQEILAAILPEEAPVAICPSLPDGVELFQATGALGLEGIVSKELAGRYHPGRKHPTWRKVKHSRRLQAVVGGILLKQGRAKAVLLGLWSGGGLVYIGRAATGLSERDLTVLTGIARTHAAGRSPFKGMPLVGRGLEAAWLEIPLTARVRFTGWTDQGRLRHPVLEGFGDQAPEDCVFPL